MALLFPSTVLCATLCVWTRKERPLPSPRQRRRSPRFRSEPGLRRNVLQARSIWVGNGTVDPMPGCCPYCALFHDGPAAGEACQALRDARNSAQEVEAWRELTRALNDGTPGAS